MKKISILIFLIIFLGLEGKCIGADAKESAYRILIDKQEKKALIIIRGIGYVPTAETDQIYHRHRYDAHKMVGFDLAHVSAYTSMYNFLHAHQSHFPDFDSFFDEDKFIRGIKIYSSTYRSKFLPAYIVEMAFVVTVSDMSFMKKIKQKGWVVEEGILPGMADKTPFTKNDWGRVSEKTEVESF